MPREYSAPVLEFLCSSGWTPGRENREVVQEFLRRWGGPPVPKSVEEVLLEFSGIGSGSSNGRYSSIANPFLIDPREGLGGEDGFEESGLRIRTTLFPLGDVSDGMGDLAIAEDGRVIIFDDDSIWLVGKDIAEALDVLLTNKEITKLADQLPFSREEVEPFMDE